MNAEWNSKLSIIMATKVVANPEVDILKDEREGRLREVGNQAVWSLSSCKPGFGVEQLLDNTVDAYWQSDGPQPHLVNIQFRRKTTIHDVCIYTDYKADESYTPNRISLRAGTHFNDLIEVDQIELSEPVGWVCVPMKDINDKPIRTFMVQIAVLSNHQNGRDTHLRRIKIRSPVQDTYVVKTPKFTSLELMQLAYIK
ncbi:anaphase-promoting complex subunit 10-like isoform X1 [Saccostrea echinata]|uniref:anaphase-promoting complex subunit 10-like isoform X1 n=2 Tax=Saccostrea echinata TaxID=191078 RepID=UPI002A83D383|nr:anaphase-promoting complex subunit 10-like isoform X1 [Saccostrea echinata]